MKIRLKKSLIQTLSDFNMNTEERENGGICQYFHPEYGIVYDDKDTIFEVLGIKIEDGRIFFIRFRTAPDGFEFFSEAYFEIIDYSIPMIWGVGGFPKGYRFFYSNGISNTAEKATYYWSLPIFYSDYFFFGDYYYSPVDKYKFIFDTYNEQLSLSENYRLFSEDEFYRQIDFIKQLL